MSQADTICARATASGRAGVAIVRVSGAAVPAIAAGLFGSLPPARQAVLRAFRDGSGEAIDTGIALYFAAPHSFTGEDVLELQGHGGIIVSDLLIERVLELGARLARPGEFSERAFLNDRIDLFQAEAIADLIDSGSRAAVRAAQRSLSGEFSRRVHALDEELTQLRIFVEAAIDFPDEEIDFLADDELTARLDRLGSSFDALDETCRQGCLLGEGVQLVLAGRPNAGKSSLLNALAGYDAAIVTPVPGTTRDLVREAIDLDGLPVHIIDTAGLRESADLVEQEGLRRTHSQLAQADHALLLVDASEPVDATLAGLRRELPAGLATTVVHNKIDLTGDPPGLVDGAEDTVRVSALTGAGLPMLRKLLATRLGYAGIQEGSITARRRHLESLRQARARFETGRRLLAEQRAGELLAEELRLAQQDLADITGEFTSDDLLGRIFASFCIGK
ncbi:MAG: tRNA uridine-5-carboxymethylaminomethyl(34) synthesis GTPase MnmE [Chromatiales bacterium]|nr:tRNA uridine-5-carboxymethylaminomethyl(34) synthesis GTPase MnmE [Chromatiales bacterium]